MPAVGIVMVQPQPDGAMFGEVRSPAAAKEEHPWRAPRTKLADLEPQSPGSTTCADESATSPMSFRAGDESPQSVSSDEDAQGLAKCGTSEGESRMWSKSTTCSSANCVDATPSGEEEEESEEESDQCGSIDEPHQKLQEPRNTEDAIADKLALLGQAGIVSALARILSHLASMGNRPHKPTMFHAQKAPPIPIQDYLTRIAMYYSCSDSCLVLGLIYIDRLVKLHPHFVVSVFNVHRLVAVSVMLAAKYQDDVYYSNAHYGKVAGLSVMELNKLEEAFLKLLNWRVCAPPKEFEIIVDHVLTAAGVKA